MHERAGAAVCRLRRAIIARQIPGGALKQKHMSRRFASLVGLFAVAFLACFLIWPVVQTVRGAFFDANGTFTTEYFAEIFRNRIYLEGLQNALLLAVASTALTFLIALPLAWMGDRFDFAGKKVLSTLLLVPMIMPPFVGAIGIRKVFGQMGA